MINDLLENVCENSNIANLWKSFPEEEPQITLNIEEGDNTEYLLPCITTDDYEYHLWFYSNGFWYGAGGVNNIGRPRCKFIQLVENIEIPENNEEPEVNQEPENNENPENNEEPESNEDPENNNEPENNEEI